MTGRAQDEEAVEALTENDTGSVLEIDVNPNEICVI